jgi:hypothetical protein
MSLGRLQVHAVCTGCEPMAELDLTTGRSWWLFVGPELLGRFAERVNDFETADL